MLGSTQFWHAAPICNLCVLEQCCRWQTWHEECFLAVPQPCSLCLQAALVGTASAHALWGGEMLQGSPGLPAAAVVYLCVCSQGLFTWCSKSPSHGLGWFSGAFSQAFCHSCLQDRSTPITKSYSSKVILCRNELGWVEVGGHQKNPPKPNQNHKPFNSFSSFLTKIHLNFHSATVSSITWHALARFLSLQLFSVLRKSASGICNTSFGYWSDNRMYLWGIWVWNKAICYKTLVPDPFLLTALWKHVVFR